MRKRFGKRGFTLAEMLIAIALLGFVTAMTTVMTSVVLRSTVMMREVAQAEILGSEALDNLQGQLRVAYKVQIDASGVTFDLDTANKGYTFAVEDGQIILGKMEEGKVKGEPLFAGVSYGDLRVTSLQFSDGGGETIQISLAISYGEKTLWNGSVTVKPLNGVS